MASNCRWKLLAACAYAFLRFSLILIQYEINHCVILHNIMNLLSHFAVNVAIIDCFILQKILPHVVQILSHLQVSITKQQRRAVLFYLP